MNHAESECTFALIARTIYVSDQKAIALRMIDTCLFALKRTTVFFTLRDTAQGCSHRGNAIAQALVNDPVARASNPIKLDRA